GQHALRSQEWSSVAFGEGFAHFLSTLAFNDHTETDGYFRYYKDLSAYSHTTTSRPTIGSSTRKTLARRAAAVTARNAAPRPGPASRSTGCGIIGTFAPTPARRRRISRSSRTWSTPTRIT